MRGTVLLLLSFSTVYAGPKPGDKGTPEFEAATKLIKQLGAARYATRETAAKKILEMRGRAIPALTAAAKSSDEEVRNRCKSLLSEVKAADWKDRAQAFLADPGGKHKDDPILFADYEKVVGKLNDGSRKLFAEMLRSDLELFVMAVRNPEAVEPLLKAQCRKLSKEAMKGQVPIRGTVGELATLFFLHDQLPPAKSPGSSGDHPVHQLANPGLDAMAARDVGPALRRIVVHWAERRPAGDTWAHMFFPLAAGRRKIAEAVPLLRGWPRTRGPTCTAYASPRSGAGPGRYA